MASESETRGLQASVDGFAHEHIACGILMKKYKNVSLVDLPLSTYDIMIVFKGPRNNEVIIRAQVKTSKKSLPFTGGSRGGVDRRYISGVKTYVQSPKTSDVIIGVKPVENDQYELYFFPTLLIEELNQKSISLNKIKAFKNNYEILEKCKKKAFILKKAREAKILKEETE